MALAIALFNISEDGAPAFKEKPDPMNSETEQRRTSGIISSNLDTE
jgi:hypothetical protein